uniref:Uncharacterized protein n=1 Tax=Arundo donax TaxID=35708 RepID=A0A0A9B3Z7_ARUDO
MDYIPVKLHITSIQVFRTSIFNLRALLRKKVMACK